MNLGNGFAAGLAQGQQFTRGIADAYRAGQQMNDARDQAAQKEALKGIASATAVESTGYTADQGKELEGLAANGYKIDFDGAQKAYVARNEAGDTKTIAMQGVTDFMGERTQGSMSREQQDSTRMLAMADVIGRTDPERGLQMRQQFRQGQHAEKRQAREEKQWAREDGIEALDKELGQAFESSLIGEDGKRRAPTATDYLQSNQQRAFKLAQGGYMAEAEKAFKDNLSTAHIKIQMDAAERKQALGPAMAALGSGDYGAVAEFYNRFVPSGAKVTGIEADKDGGLVMNRTGIDGKPLAPLRAKDQREAMAMLQSLENPGALYQYSQDEFRNQLQLKADRRADHADQRAAGADARAAASHGIAMEDRRERLNDKRELRDVREAMARESNPSISDTQIRAVRAGIMQTPGADNAKAKYDYDPVKVQKAFGETIPARFAGEKDSVKRDMDKEQRFREFMADNPNIRDVDEGLVKFNAADVKRTRGEKAGRASAVQGAMSPEAIAATAKKYGMTEDQVRDKLRSQGLIK
ncbi:hypothetical protein [Delftia tsuruhatensis]|uniref:hypothetical protein n=1 Tax=Delftia tsuruhatensis TaxID=180282 RepID=UPI002260AA5C|nr:hypothetical protein [Delftia tsuruhatensis]MCX7505872.1 hypothetical protein [Delftia tsuruhatensis]